jgi:hypothetical protein
MDHIRRLGNSISISIPADENAFTGRECPQLDCEGYFKIELGTGLKGEGLPCHCPYCGHTAGHDQFWTKEQIEYARSVAMRKITDAIHKDLKKLEFDHKPKGALGIGISMKFKPGHPTPIHHYREKQLETEVVCVNCTLRYSVYGVFAFCPDCGQHNSLQILYKNLELVDKMLAVAEVQEQAVAQVLVENALEDCVSSFDGFGRETCRVFSPKSAAPEKAAGIRFQNIASARQRVNEQFGVDFAASLEADVWVLLVRCFQKRHLLAHKMGVIDEDYIKATGELGAVVGRKLQIQIPEVRALASALQAVGRELFVLLEKRQ